MLSRLLSARTATRSLSRFAVPTLTRSFKTAPTLMQSTAPAATKVDGPSEIVSKYGTATFWGMVAAIMVSKEMFILDAEFLLSCEIIAFGATAYILTGDTLTKMSEEQDVKVKEQFDGANDFMIEMFNQYKMVQSTVQNKPEVMEQYATEFKAAIEANAAFQTVKPKHEARAKVLAALQQMKSKEDHEAMEAWQSAVDVAVANVNAAFSAKDKKLEDQMMDLAISNIGYQVGVTSEKEDPVKRLFLKEFA